MPVTPMKRKYGNTKTEIDGYIFDSKREASYYRELKYRKMAGEITEIKLQPVYELQPKFKHGKNILRPITYIADFEIILKNGKRQAIDVKGFKTRDYMLKKKLFMFIYPEIEFLEIK